MFKAQTSIDNFFTSNSNKNKYEINRYFYLSWTNKYKPDFNAYWTNKKPEKINFVEQINCDYIKKGYFFYICGYIEDNNDRLYNISKEKVYKNIHYLKSHLQKCIRKKDDHRAIQSCHHLLKLDVGELLRRLIIIMLEDTSIHECFPTLVWLMIATSSKKFKKEVFIYEWILGAVYVLCKIDDKPNIYDIYEKNILLNEKIPVYQQLDSYNKLNDLQMSLLYSMHLRIAYGGMQCDMEMIEKYINILDFQFNNGKTLINISTIDIRPISIYIRDLELNEWDLSAIDYHCNSKFLDYIHKKYDHIEKDELQKIIWHHSSSINLREQSTNYNSKCWKEIKNHVEKTQKYLLDSSY
jgi:hypothetical protein